LAKRGWGDFMDDFLSEKSPLFPPLLKGGFQQVYLLKKILPTHFHEDPFFVVLKHFT